jgi:hypothetical protein
MASSTCMTHETYEKERKPDGLSRQNTFALGDSERVTLQYITERRALIKFRSLAKVCSFLLYFHQCDEQLFTSGGDELLS